jgi:hypothetical protein
MPIEHFPRGAESLLPGEIVFPSVDDLVSVGGRLYLNGDMRLDPGAGNPDQLLGERFGLMRIYREIGSTMFGSTMFDGFCVDLTPIPPGNIEPLDPPGILGHVTTAVGGVGNLNTLVIGSEDGEVTLRSIMAIVYGSPDSGRIGYSGPEELIADARTLSEKTRKLIAKERAAEAADKTDDGVDSEGTIVAEEEGATAPTRPQ